MAKRVCKQCGAALNEGVRFCTSCGAKMDFPETAGVFAPETRPFNTVTGGQMSEGVFSATEELPSPQTPSSYDTEEMPLPAAKEQAEEKSIPPPAATLQTKPSSGGRKGLLLAATLGVVVLAAGAFFFFNSRSSSETQAMNQSADPSEQSATARPIAEPSVNPSVAASDQTQPQAELAADELKSRVAGNTEAISKPGQTRGEGTAAPTPSAEKNDTEASGAAEHNLNQGIRYLGAGRFQDALREFEYVKKLDPGNKNVYYLIGQAYHNMNQLERALEAYRQCTSGVYASIAQNHVRTLEKKLGKTY